MVGSSEHLSEWTTPWTDPASQELRTGPALSLPFHHHHPSLGPHASSAPGEQKEHGGSTHHSDHVPTDKQPLPRQVLFKAQP